MHLEKLKVIYLLKIIAMCREKWEINVLPILGVPFLFLHLIHFYLSFFCFGAEIELRSLHMLGKHPTPEPLCSHCLNEHTLIHMCAY